MLTKASMLKEYKKMAAECRADLKTMKADDLGRPAVEGNLKKCEMWIKFLSEPDVPELNDPNFNKKMKALKPKKAKKQHE